MDLDLLHTFVTVVRLHGMRRAAEALHVTQPAVSARIRALEARLDVRLFERRGRHLHLTSAGQVLLDEGQALLSAAAAVRRRLSPLRGLQRGTLRLATIDSVSIYLLPEIYLEFRRSHPEIELLVQVVDSRRVLEAVRRRDADLGFVALPEARRSWSDRMLRIQPFYEDVLVIVGRPGHPLAGARRLDLATLAAQPLILYSRGSHTRSTLDRVFRAHRITPHVAMETESPEAMKHLAAAGVGLAILPLAHVRPELDSGRLCRLQAQDARFCRTLAAVTRRDRPLEPAAAHFNALLLARWPPLVARKRNRDPWHHGSRQRGTSKRSRLLSRDTAP